MRRLLIITATVAACGTPPPPEPPITVYAAASLARPLRVIADSFRLETRIPVQVELGGSLELSRRVTELGATPDVLLLADDEVIAALMPAHADWYARFATSTLVIAYRRQSGPDSLSTDNWWEVLSRDGVTVGRADSALAPAGRHALGVLRRAEGYYGRPGLSARLLSRSPIRLVRPNASELAALLEAGEVDYILDYESVARQYGFSYVPLPADFAPRVLYGATVPRAAPRQAAGVRFVAYLLGARGERLLRAAQVEVLRVPVVLGRNVPDEISAVGRVMARMESSDDASR